MYSNNQSKTRIGKVSIRLKGSNYKLRWTYPQKKRHEIFVAQNDEEGWEEVARVAKMINRDIALDDLDSSYARYSYRYRHKVEIASQEASLKQLWQNYQNIKQHTTQESTQKKEWERLNILFDQLITQGKVHKYLKPYSLRHSFIIRLVQSGAVDIKNWQPGQ